MYRYLLIIPLIFLILLDTSCNDDKKKTQPTLVANKISKPDSVISENVPSKIELIESLSGFLPKGYMIFDTIYGDLNNDGREDCVLIIKSSDKSKIVKDEYRGDMDRNRRGLIVLLNKISIYEILISNKSCFSSENEDGGVYFPPELYIEIEKGKLFIHYAHGRYGYWSYNFRIKQDDLELIGYDQSENHGPIVNHVISINFLTKKRLIRENINYYTEEPENEVFKETWENLKVRKMLQLSEIDDFDYLEFSEW